MVSLGLFVALCGLSVSSADGWTESCLVRLLLLFGVVAVRCCSLVTEVCDCECCCCLACQGAAAAAPEPIDRKGW